MHISVAVFLALTVIYAGTFVLPYDLGAKALPFASEAASASCAVATFFIVKSGNMGLASVALLLAAATAFVALSGLATLACTTRQRPCSKTQAGFVAHSLLFSSPIMVGTAAYFAYAVGSMAGLPLWAAVVAAVVLTPLYVVYALPPVADGVTRLTEMRA